jgi:hypothetical protein
MTDERFVQTVLECKTMAYACKQVGMAYRSFVKRAKQLGVYKPNPGGAGTHKGSSGGYRLEDVLNGYHPQYPTYKLKLRLIKENILKDECSLCSWKEKPEGAVYTPCELDHIDGNPCNHFLSNLRMLCPNCHSLQKTYRFRRGRSNGIIHKD